MELEQINEWLDLVENAIRGQPKMAPNVHRRERVPPRHVAEDFEEFNEGNFKEEDDKHLVGSIICLNNFLASEGRCEILPHRLFCKFF